MASETYHEPYESLSEPTKDIHRAIVSLMEELEAIDWYQQRADVCGSDELRAVLIHNKNEEIEHAMMVLEWIRRNSAVFDRNIRTYLLTQGPITGVEEGMKGAEGAADPARGGDAGDAEAGPPVARARLAATAAVAPRAASGTLGIGSLKKG
jgi:ferritin-like protein